MGDGLDIVRGMFEVVKEIPVTFGPHEADWLMVVVTAAAAVASFVIARRAWLTSRDAKSVAEKAIREQKRLQDERIAVDYAAALNGAIAELFREIRNYIEPLEDWFAEGMQNSSHEARPDGTEVFSWPKPPTFDRIRASVEAVHLFAQGDDLDVAEQVDKTLAPIVSLPAPSQWQQLMQVLTAVRLWRTGRTTIDETIETLTGLEESSHNALRG